MKKERIAYLYQRYQQHLATPQEMAEWGSVLQDPQQKILLDEVVDASYYVIPETELIAMDGNREAEILNFIVSHRTPHRSRILKMWPRFSIAAAIAIFMIGGMIFFVSRFREHTNDPAVAHILPGKEGATLTLANGRKIKLGNAANGELARESGVRIRKTAKGQIVYEVSDVNAVPGQMNTLTTANGETYMVLLPDKSKVWLNAASELKYPASFAGISKRMVQLDGEAYFEVVRDKAHPFIVQSARQEVTVLGTHFDVNSYRDNEAVKTTLLEGRVAVRRSGIQTMPAADSLILKPDQQAILTPNSINELDVEASDAIAWKNGYFMFNNEELGSIMKTLSRWYNTTIVYDDDETLKHELVFAKLSRYENISKILKMMERTDKLKFRVEGRTITISRIQK
ncbi:FecR family protein [Mucilaginibacter ginsenosidivorax]|uniref:DUF4974 domain-containing protein n=1 Tax=Mucilaginibacter ginsenosidivorax TaxID=862126 RepID=A0A5B8W5C0_9SPHI|nr:FecR family protein [Mucilaginibacter ginsenosidivorax]QEC78871.1 DUF4974 domain-containing protein [Mucilaginibacter ginsenosidivorax]